MGYARRSPEGFPAAVAGSEENARDAVRALSRQARGRALFHWDVPITPGNICLEVPV